MKILFEVSVNINGEVIHSLASNCETIKVTSKIVGAQMTVKKDTNNNTPFSLGSESMIEKIAGKLYLSIRTQLDNDLEIE